MRIEIARLHKDLSATIIYVTHDQVEAMTLADKIVVLRDGRIEQVGAPLKLYDDPDNLFVAGFIGSPRMNFVKARVQGDRLSCPTSRPDAPPSASLDPPRRRCGPDRGLRPDAFRKGGTASIAHS